MQRFIMVLVVLLALPATAEQQAPMAKTGRYTSETVFVGGKLSDGRDVKRIRHGVHPGMERVVIDIFGSNRPVNRPSSFRVEPDGHSLLVTVTGVRHFSATFPRAYPGDRVTGYERVVYEDDSGFQFRILTRQPPSYEVFELQKPGRIVIDLR